MPRDSILLVVFCIDGDDRVLRRRSAVDTRSPRFLPEHVDLGLRLTVGEDTVQKPSLPSSVGGSDPHFPEAFPYTEASPAGHGRESRNSGIYYPAKPTNDVICSPPSTLIALIVVILVINVVMVAAFAIFYRQKRKYWSKKVGVMGMAPTATTQSATAATASAPPPLPSRPSSAVYGQAGGVAAYKTAAAPSSSSSSSPYNQPQGVARQRIAGLHAAAAQSMTSLPRGEDC